MFHNALKIVLLETTKVSQFGNFEVALILILNQTRNGCG